MISIYTILTHICYRIPTYIYTIIYRIPTYMFTLYVYTIYRIPDYVVTLFIEYLHIFIQHAPKRPATRKLGVSPSVSWDCMYV